MPVHVSPRTGELAVSLCLLGLAAYVAATSANMPLGDLAAPGPGLFPLVVAVLLGIVALALIFENRRGRRQAGSASALAGTQTLTTLAALAGFTAGWNAIGFPIGSCLFLGLLFRVLGGLAWIAAVPAGAATGLGLWGLFTWALGVSLPPGPLG